MLSEPVSAMGWGAGRWSTSAILLLLAVSSPAPAAAAGAYATVADEVTFGHGFLQINFGPKALWGTLGRSTEQGRRADPLSRWQIGCLASTPPLQINGEAVVDVDFFYEASSQLWALPAQAAAESVFWVVAGPGDATSPSDTRGGVQVGQLGLVTEIVPPSNEDPYGFYEASTAGEKALTMANIAGEESMDRFSAHVCNLGSGASVLVRRIAVRIRHGRSQTYVEPAEQFGAPAADENLMSCEREAPVATGCIVAPRILDGVQSEDTEFRVRYLFDCEGAPLGLALQTESTQHELQPTSVPQEAALVGQNYLKLSALDPSFTHASYVLPGCTLHILGVGRVPSAATLTRWTDEARAMAEALRDKLGLVRLAQGTEHILAWDAQQLGMLRPSLAEAVEGYLVEQGTSWRACGGADRLLAGEPLLCDVAWSSALAAHPEMLHYIVLLLHVQAAIDGRPTVTPPYAVRDAAVRLNRSLTDHYTAELRAKIEEALRLRARLQAARQVAHQDLETALDEVKALVERDAVRAPGDQT